MSLLGLPATVTVPGFEGCRNWRWLPFIRTWFQPSSFVVMPAQAGIQKTL